MTKSFKMLLFGFTLHSIIWFINVATSSAKGLYCSEGGCYFLVAIDLPFSLLYAAGGQEGISIWSLGIGGLWWGFVFILIKALTCKLQRKSAKQQRS